LSIRVTSTTPGRVTPGLATISGGYRYKGRAGWPDDPACRDTPAPAEDARARQQRIREYAARRDSGLTPGQAAARAGVSDRTGRDYEQHYQADLASREPQP
jgi:hypothetical protein